MFGGATIPYIFQYDNAPVHTARNMQTWLDKRDVQVIQNREYLEYVPK